MSTKFSLEPGKLTLADIHTLLEKDSQLELSPDAWLKIDASQAYVDKMVAEGTTVYGINTGFGLLANTKISQHELEQLQRNILLSHAAGTGELLADKISKLVMLLKINSLSRGFSGVRRVVILRLIQLYNHQIYPTVPSKGSVGASGDLAPLAHLVLPLIGEGTARYQGTIISGLDALKLIDEKPLVLAPKEGLALINGTQVSTAIALYHLLQAQDLLNASILVGALTVDATLGSKVPFNPLIHEVRGHAGQILVAKRLTQLLEDSPLMLAHKDCENVQDPYCIRCQPQVLGACLDNLLHVAKVLTIEANAVSDNPLVFAADDKILSGGNFHAEPVAQVADALAIAIAEIGAIAERRIALLVDPHFNRGLPAFLAPKPGINSGFMIGHVTAAALASANKSLAHPYSVDSIPTSANQEDHVSMATFAALRLKDMLEHVRDILAIEFLAASQAIDLRRPLQTSKKLETVVAALREEVSMFHEDRYFAPDIEAAARILEIVSTKQAAFLYESERS